MSNAPFRRFDISRYTPYNPAYIIQPCGIIERRKEVRLLLGLHLETTLLGLGMKYPQKGNARRIHVKSDAPEGVQMGHIHPSNPHDIFGHVGGDRKYRETVYAKSGNFVCDIEATGPSRSEAERSSALTRPEGATFEEKIKITRFETQKSTLFVERRRLFHPDIAPELREYKAEPFFGEIGLVPFTFGELVDAVRTALGDGGYILID